MKIKLHLLTLFSLIIFFGFFSTKSASADWPVAGDVTQINSNTIQIDNLGSGWNGCNDFWYAQVSGSTDNYTYPLAGGTLGNELTGSSCQTISSSSIQVTFSSPYNFYFYPETYKVFYANNNNYDSAYYTNTFTVTSSNPPQDTNTYTNLFSDNFTDTDGTTLTAHNSNWALQTGTDASIENNQLVIYPNSNYDLQNFTSTGDQCISYDVQFPVNGAIYTWTRYNPTTQSGFFTYVKADDNSYGIYDIVNNNANYIASGAHTWPTSGTHTVKVCSIGETTVLYLDGLSIASGQSTDNATGTGSIYDSAFSETPNVIDNLLYQSVSTTPISSLVTAINAGGDTEGSFAADTGFSGGSTFSSSSTVDTSGVTNPAPQAVYQTVRYGNFSYTIPNLTPNTNYTLRLHFNEVYFGANGNSGGVGSRVFNVAVNGTTALSNFDIYQAAGGANKAVVEELPATSDSNGNITVQFSSVVDNAMVNGIEVDSGSPSVSPTPTPTPITSEAINAGGGTEGSFVSDIDSTGGSAFSTSADVDTTGVTNPAPESVYQSVRYGNFTYDLTNFAPNSSHTVRLHFSEPYWGTALASGNGGDGSRVFNVSINGTQVLTNFDVYQTAGGADKAVIEEFPVTADSNGKISIQFSTVTDNAMVSGIEVN